MATDGSIINAPLSDNSWLVYSVVNKRPNYKRAFARMHLLWPKNVGDLYREMIQSYLRGKKGPNLSTLAYRGMPSHSGDNPGTRHRKRQRKTDHSRDVQPQAKVSKQCQRKIDAYLLRQISGTRIRMCCGRGSKFAANSTGNIASSR